MPRLWPSPAPWCPAARPQSLWRKVRFTVRGLPSPWDSLGAGHRKVLGEAQPSRWGHSWVPCKPSLLSLSLGVPSGCRGHHPSLCSQPLGGPFQPRTLGLIPTHTHTPAPLLLPSPTLLPPGPKTTSEAAWGYRPDPAPTSPGPRAVCVCVPTLAPCQGQVPGGTLPGRVRSPSLLIVHFKALLKEGPRQELVSPRGLRTRRDRSDLGPRWARCLLLRPPLGTWPALGPSWKIPRAHSETRAAQASLVPRSALPRAGAVRASLPTSTTPALLLTMASVPDRWLPQAQGRALGNLVATAPHSMTWPSEEAGAGRSESGSASLEDCPKGQKGVGTRWQRLAQQRHSQW